MPDSFRWMGLIISTGATVVASQAIISASFTLINEAIRLNFWPKVHVKYPTDYKGQIYIPSINWLLCICSIVVVLYFKDSSKMEAAYGLTINLDMIMTSTLLVFFIVFKKISVGNPHCLHPGLRDDRIFIPRRQPKQVCSWRMGEFYYRCRDIGCHVELV
jgi:KUP system potassium uptake protein